MTVTDHTTGGSWSWSTMMKPIQMRMMERLVRTMRQQTPLVLGQNGLGADMVSTARPAFMVFLLLTVLMPLAAVMLVPLLLTLFPLENEYVSLMSLCLLLYLEPESRVWSVTHPYGRGWFAGWHLTNSCLHWLPMSVVDHDTSWPRSP